MHTIRKSTKSTQPNLLQLRVPAVRQWAGAQGAAGGGGENQAAHQEHPATDGPGNTSMLFWIICSTTIFFLVFTYFVVHVWLSQCTRDYSMRDHGLVFWCIRETSSAGIWTCELWKSKGGSDTDCAAPAATSTVYLETHIVRMLKP